MNAIEAVLFGEQLEQYKYWLTEQFAIDQMNREQGVEPIPRSAQEKEAIYWNLPRAMRKQPAIQRRYLGSRFRRMVGEGLG